MRHMTHDSVMTLHRVVFVPSGHSVNVPHGITIAEAARLASEAIATECRGRGACGRCLMRVEAGDVPEYRVLRRESGAPLVLACQTPVHGPLTLRPLAEAALPRLHTRDQAAGRRPLDEWAPFPLDNEPLIGVESGSDLGVAVDIGTTTIRLLVIRLADGTIVGDAGGYNPQIPLGADVISRIIAAEEGQLGELASRVRRAVAEMVAEATTAAGVDPARISAYTVAGNLTMIYLLLQRDPSRIRLLPPLDLPFAFAPIEAASFGWPGKSGAGVHTVPAAGRWVGGDIVSGVVRAGLSRVLGGLWLYVDLGTNGEIAMGGSDFALTCACSAGPAFEGGGILCGMRADRGAIDGARIDADQECLLLSVIGGGAVRGICGSGLIALADELFRCGWLDRGGRFTDRVPQRYRVAAASRLGLRLSRSGKIALWERDLGSLLRAKAAVFAGIRSLLGALGIGVSDIDRVVVSGNFGRFLNLPAAVGIGLLPDLPPERYEYLDNGSLEGASLMLLSKQYDIELRDYLRRITYVDLSEVPGYMDEFVGASFLPHTDPALLGRA
jgi:uncharacterized 2Fe-2S/4Fe-4S cluster protein (DUF4445 family)